MLEKTSSRIKKALVFAARTMVSVVVVASLLAVGCNAFTVVQRQRSSPSRTTGGVVVSKGTNKKATSNLDFDFSSTRGWETHYQRADQYDEWHTTIDFETILKYCPPKKTKDRTTSHAVSNSKERTEEKEGEEERSLVRFLNSGDETKTAEKSDTTTKTRVLMIGCGTSRLPEAFDASLYQCTLLDAAPTCIDTLRRRYGDDAYEYITGDALRMHRNHTGTFDYVVDKGLMDALLCGEGWSLWVHQLLDSVYDVLSQQDEEGRYILVSYRLPSSTMAFLQHAAGSLLEWNFQVDGSNPRVMISIARRRQPQPPPPMPQQLTYRWRALDQQGAGIATGSSRNKSNNRGAFVVDDFSSQSSRRRVMNNSYWDE
jgi:ribosomal protein L44E